jgi:hypothetical protein
MAWNGGSQFWPDCTDKEWRKSVLALLDWHGMEEVSFGLTVLTRNGGSRSWSYSIDWHGMEEVSFGLTGMAWS